MGKSEMLPFPVRRSSHRGITEKLSLSRHSFFLLPTDVFVLRLHNAVTSAHQRVLFDRTIRRPRRIYSRIFSFSVRPARGMRSGTTSPTNGCGCGILPPNTVLDFESDSSPPAGLLLRTPRAADERNVADQKRRACAAETISFLPFKRQCFPSSMTSAMTFAMNPAWSDSISSYPPAEHLDRSMHVHFPYTVQVLQLVQQ